MKTSCFLKKLLVPLVGAGLLLCGCGEVPDAPGETAAAPTTVVTTAAAETVPLQKGDLIEEIEVQGEYIEEGWLEPIAYHYRLPQILDDSPDAQEVNRELRKFREDAEQGLIPYDSIDWDSHWNGPLLSLVVHVNRTFLDDPGAFTYNYDFAQRRSLSNEALMARLDSDMDIGSRAFCRAAVQQFDRDLQAGGPLPDDLLQGLIMLRAETISTAGLDFSRVPLYLDDRGQLHGFALIGTYAGGGAYTEDLVLELEPSALTKQADCGFITAVLRNDQVELTFRQEGLADLMITPGSIQWDHPYPVEGLYGSYTDLAVGYLGNGGLCCLFLLDENGQITFCNLFESIDCGNRFTAVGPIQLPEKAVAFRQESDEGGSLLSAVLESGLELDLYQSVLHWEALPHPFHYFEAWYTEDNSHSLDFAGAPYDLRWRSGSQVPAAGEERRYMGMTGDGMLYELWFLTEEGRYVGTVLTDQCISGYLFPDGTGAMVLEPFTENTLPGLQPGVPVSLYVDLFS